MCQSKFWTVLMNKLTWFQLGLQFWRHWDPMYWSKWNLWRWRGNEAMPIWSYHCAWHNLCGFAPWHQFQVQGWWFGSQTLYWDDIKHWPYFSDTSYKPPTTSDFMTFQSSYHWSSEWVSGMLPPPGAIADCKPPALSGRRAMPSSPCRVYAAR